MTAPPDTCWLHPAVTVMPSSIAGRGLATSEPLPEATVVSRLGGRVVDADELHRLFAEASRTGGYVDTVALAVDRHLVLPAGTPNGAGNHSCDPNLWWADEVTLVTRRPVHAGEELTSDYATSSDDPGFRMTCTCGSPLCRGEVRGDDWRRPELQERYAGHWVPHLERRIALG